MQLMSCVWIMQVTWSNSLGSSIALVDSQGGFDVPASNSVQQVRALPLLSLISGAYGIRQPVPCQA